MKSLKWKQVLAGRLAQQGLSQRFQRKDRLEAVSRTAGLQAQVMSAAELALAARVDGLSPRDVSSALWKDRALVKTWAMRATLHLLPARDLPLYAAARRLYETRNWDRFFSYYGVGAPLQKAYLEAAPHVLSDKPLTREQFAAALGSETGSKALQQLLAAPGWGTALKPIAWRGDLCFGPNDGRNVTYVYPPTWLGNWQPVEPYPALQELARRNLRTYGPGTPESFARWWELGKIPARSLFRSLEAELVPVDVEGWSAFALRDSLERMLQSEPAETVNLLPLFDAYVMGIGREFALDALVPAAHKFSVYREAGWISAVVLIGGRMTGTWEYQNIKGDTVSKVRMFAPPRPAVKKRIEVEAERLGAFLNKNGILSYVD